MTQSQLCIRIGVDQSFITRIESGVPPRTKILRELAAAFDFHPSYFLALIESAEQRADEIGTDVDGVGLRGLAEYVVAEVFR
jgi:transcriptional regulator with XRE-family HTH domain